jgi:hypothetical protein
MLEVDSAMPFNSSFVAFHYASVAGTWYSLTDRLDSTLGSRALVVDADRLLALLFVD